MCGRLRCCLVYEYEQYVEARKHLPKRGKRVETPYGQGRVLDVRVLRDSVLVALEGGE
jgi:cell fate regulator YaaT (PSP1 superfamily)